MVGVNEVVAIGSRELLTVLANQEVSPAPVSRGEIVAGPQDLKRWLRSGQVAGLLFRFRSARLLTADVRFPQRPLRAAVALRLLSRGPVWFEDPEGRRWRVSLPTLGRLVLSTLRDLLATRSLLARLDREVCALERLDRAERTIQHAGRVVYLKTDFVFGLKAGGSVAHTAGVLNHLDEVTGTPLFVTSVRLPTVREDIETVDIPPSGRFSEFNGLPMLAYNSDAYRQSKQHLRGVQVSFVYQRYSVYNFTGVRLAADLGVPFVLEYNGSEIWVNRNWGKPLAHEGLAERIELVNLRHADLVVVVSEPLRDELVKHGIDPARILVNPNGVDPQRYSPVVDGAAVRTDLGFDGKTVVGFIGTFGRWHGAEVLVDAFAEALRRRPGLRDSFRLLLIGDGQTMPLVRERIRGHDLQGLVRLTGLVAHADGPRFLAACDIYASPHVPNADGSRFFGSPTKLFEYMAMGRGIVASDLDQIGEVLTHKVNAYLVEPGSVSALADGLIALADEPEVARRLGEAARTIAEKEHSWAAHTRRIVESLAAVAR